ncbi:MAG: hypothetical protein KDB22_11470 [Planctomycetales bacterium]|nr:hypothetical protein [Planctomycetales bacterium]
MSTITKLELAVEVAERSMRKNGYVHGPCLGATLREDSSAEKWEVEFAYEGMETRSRTTDPPSILLVVDLSSQEVQSVELM